MKQSSSIFFFWFPTLFSLLKDYCYSIMQNITQHTELLVGIQTPTIIFQGKSISQEVEVQKCILKICIPNSLLHWKGYTSLASNFQQQRNFLTVQPFNNTSKGMEQRKKTDTRLQKKHKNLPQILLSVQQRCDHMQDIGPSLISHHLVQKSPILDHEWEQTI
jgi:hypothetical protein